MVKYFYFPGNSSLNEGELKEFKQMFSNENLDGYVQPWDHWSEENKEFSLNTELEKAKNELEATNEDVILIGKSIGTYFISEFILNNNLKPKKVILMGIPTGIGKDKLQKYKDAFKNSSIDLYIIQNDEDPFGPIENVKNLFEGIPYKLILKNADNHLYSYTEEVKNIIS